MTEQTLRAVIDVGLTARCDQHLDEDNSLMLILCPDCMRLQLERAQMEAFRVGLLKVRKR